jgi:N-acyl-D-amino-acid deacylase
MTLKAITLAAAISAVLGSIAVVVSWHHGGAKPIESVIENFARQNGLLGGVLVYGQLGERPVVTSFGHASRRNGRPLVADDRFKIASLSKPVTAAAVLALVHEGKFTLDTRLVDLWPAVQSAVDGRSKLITVRHLLQHTAGWDHSLSFDPYFIDDESVAALTGARSKTIATCARLADAMLARPLQFMPGTRYSYSNLGYCWLGRILARYGEGSYERAARRLIPELDGFSLDTSDLTVHPEVSAEEAPFLANDPMVVAAAGGWITDARSYFEFAARLPGPEVLEQPISVSDNRFYGLGWGIRDLPQGLFLGHFGAMPGVFSIVIRKPDGPVIVALFNGRPRDPHRSFDDLFEAIANHPIWPG